MGLLLVNEMMAVMSITEASGSFDEALAETARYLYYDAKTMLMMSATFLVAVRSLTFVMTLLTLSRLMRG